MILSKIIFLPIAESKLNKSLFILILIKALSAVALPLPLPFNEFSYILARNRLEFIDEKNLYHKVLSTREKIVDIYFQKLKSEEFKALNSSSPDTSKYFYPSRPIETELVQIQNSNLYKQLKLLPKGGNLHMHEGQMLNRSKLLEMIQLSEEYDYLYICDKNNSKFCQINTNLCQCKDYYLKYFKKVNATNPDGWIKVKDSDWTIEKIVNKTTLIGILNQMDTKLYPTDSAARWKVALDNGLFDFYTDLITYNKTRFDYLKGCLDDALSENVQLIEFRRSNFNGLYTFDSNDDRIVNVSPEEELKIIESFKNDYIHKNEDLIDFTFIIYGSRRNSKEEIRKNLEDTIGIQKQFPDLIRGFDLVSKDNFKLLYNPDK